VKSKYIAKIFVARAMRPREIELYCYELIIALFYVNIQRELIIALFLRVFITRELFPRAISAY